MKKIFLFYVPRAVNIKQVGIVYGEIHDVYLKLGKLW